MSLIEEGRVRFVHITIYDVPSKLIKEFGEKIVKPYYSGGISMAIRDLMRKAVEEQKKGCFRRK